MKKFIVEQNEILGFEPYFNKLVLIAMINHERKEIRPTNGYFYPHKYGKKAKKYAESIGYTFNNN
jgi:hypothetical protein